MRGFFLLLLSLTTGCEARTEVKGCVGGWVEFTCKYPNQGKKYDVIQVKKGRKSIKSTKPDEWETMDRVSMYHDRNKRSLKVLIKQFRTYDVGEWKCEFGRSSNPSTDTITLRLDPGCEASNEVEGCVGGWVEFICRYPDPAKNYKFLKVINGTKTVVPSNKTAEWETEGRVSLYHDQKERFLRVLIRQLQIQDAVEWKCKFGGSSDPPTDTIKIRLEPDQVSCEGPFIQTAYKKNKTTVSCEYPNHEYPNHEYPNHKYPNHKYLDHEYDSDDVFFCKEPKKLREQKESSPFCEDVSFDEKFAHTETDGGFRVSISEVSLEDQGVYWCGLKTESSRAGVSNLKFKNIRVFKKKPIVGGTLLYWCEYLEGIPETKFICKGDDPSVCQTLISSNNLTNGRFSMKDDPEKRNITITVRDVRAEDNGTYWCGAKSTSNTHSDIIYHKLFMNVVPSPTTTSAPTSPAPGNPVAPAVVIAVIACVIVLLLLLLLSLLIYKRFSKRPRSRAAASAASAAAHQHNKENYIYEEIPERTQDPGPMKTVYATVDFPRNPSASLHYSTIEFKQSSDKAAGDGLTLKPSSSGCEYSFVKPSPAVDHQSVVSEEPLYSTVNKK